MGIDGGISGSTSERFIFFIRDMFTVLLNISFGETEIDDENFMLSFSGSNKEIIRFDISV